MIRERTSSSQKSDHQHRGPPEGEPTTSSSMSSEMDVPDDERRPQPYTRTNFSRGYVPPPPPSAVPTGPPKVHRARASWDEESLPFDQREDTVANSPDDEAAKISTRVSHDSDQPGRIGYRYHASDLEIQASGSPPRTHHLPESPISEDDSSISARAAMRDYSKDDDMDYNSDELDVTYEDSPNRGRRPKSVDHPSPGHEDEDSLFDFEEKRNATRMRSALRTSQRPRQVMDDASEDDSASFDDYGPARKDPFSLKDRTQQAWASRSKAQKSLGSASSPVADATVSFGKHHTVHEFEAVPAYDEETLDTTGTNQSNASTYTKSMESEVEDVVKDLLFIGSGKKTIPGHRKVKDQPKKRITRMSGDDGTQITQDDSGTQDDSYTLNTLDDTFGEDTAVTRDTTHTNQTKDTYSTLAGEQVTLSSVPRAETGESLAEEEKVTDKSTLTKSLHDESIVGTTADEDPLGAMWNYVEGGISAIGLAFGLSADDSTDRQADDTAQQVELRPSNRDSSRSPSPTAVYPSESSAVNQNQRPEPHAATPRVSEQSNSEEAGPFDESVDADVWSGREDDALPVGDDYANAPTNVGDDFVLKPRSLLTESSPSHGTPLEEDPRLQELAVHAARSKHGLHGKLFDEKTGLNVVKDIDLVVVMLALPLGLLFQENGGGCLVIKVFAEGNAAESGTVEVGDQLAAINGESAIDLKVDEICTLITESPDPDAVSLTFLRYKGPMHVAPSKVMLSNSTKNTQQSANASSRGYKGRQSAATQVDLSSKSSSKSSSKTTKEPKKTKRFRLFGRGKKS